jgi:hypothetical protein
MDITRHVVREMNDIAAARAEVEPHVGPIMGCDSAGGVYLAALSRRGHSIAGLPLSAGKAMWSKLRDVRPKLNLAMDSKAAAAMAARFPGANSLKQR